ncbi:glycosyltransferase family 4 protein [Salinarchaeum laminariae]|uniref:glycosyltransferase family 4 protein n=1 Tax=Salinarchaeum laminariae TaxID=869888 RepID=UPI0020C09404|nr:glycosyltransferase family 4 protein [Salinarchaeum laminariae]
MNATPTAPTVSAADLDPERAEEIGDRTPRTPARVDCADRADPTGEKPTASDAKTAVFFDGSPPSHGGGSEMVCRLLTRLDQDAVRPVLLAHTEDRLCERLRGEIAVDVVPFRGSLDRYDGQILEQSTLRSIGTVARLGQFNLEARSVLGTADVVWCMNLRSLLTIAPFAVGSRTPVVWNIGLGQPSEGLYRTLNSVGLRLADRVFIESDGQARRLFTDEQYEQYADSLRIFPKGIDVERFSARRATPPLSQPPYTIGTAASLTPRKGVDDFVSAAIELSAERSDVQFLVAGEPPHDADREYAEALRQRVAESDSVAESDHDAPVEFLGWVDDMPSFYDRLDAFVLPSRNEGVPGVVREALSMGLPVVATDVGGTREVVRDGETGLLIAPDAPIEIAAALRSILGNPDAARAMARRGQSLVEERFSVEAYVDRYEAFLQEVAES